MILPRRLDQRVRRFLESRGYVFLKGLENPAAIARRAKLLAAHNVDLVLDVGANEGQYGASLRRIGYRGRIHSFEPMVDAWTGLRRTIEHDASWQAQQVALGDENGQMTLHVAQNSISSSLLKMRPAHQRSAPYSRYVATETVNVCTLDELFPKIRDDASMIWLKLDVQGYESQVLDGAITSLARVTFIQSELSLVELYEGQLTYLDMCRKLEDLGFKMIGIEPGFTDASTGTLLQFDGIFKRYEGPSAGRTP